MDIGIGLPSAIPWASGKQITQWARTSEERGFSSLGAIDRLVYRNSEPLVTLGAAAAVTSRIRLMTSVLVVPPRANAAMLAKQAATVNHLAAGRLVLGMAVGGYQDDYAVSGVAFDGRGRRFDEMLDEMIRIWAGESQGYAGAIGPSRGVDRSQIVFGGHNPRAYARVASWGTGWIAGSRGVEAFRRGAEGVRRAWEAHARAGRPRLMALPYFCLGSRSQAAAGEFLTDHYAIEGPETAARLAAEALTDPAAIRKAIAAYQDAGCDELIFSPCDPDPGQIGMLSDAVTA